MKTNIFFFGDSTCVGQGVSVYSGWVTKIAEELHKSGLKNNMDIVVANSSINGRTTRQALEDMPYHIQSQKPQVLVVQFGLNDCNYWKTDNGLPRVTKLAFRSNLIEIVERAECCGVVRIFLNNNHLTTRKNVNVKDNFSYEDSNREYNAIIRDVAMAMGDRVVFSDVEKAFEEKLKCGFALESLLLEDGLHLNQNGHQVYFELLYPAMHNLLIQ